LAGPEDVARRWLAELVPEQAERYEREGFIEAPSTIYPGRVYRIHGGEGTYRTQVLERGQVARRVCLVLRDRGLPPTDRVLAEYLMIRGDERRYLRTANIARVESRPPPVREYVRLRQIPPARPRTRRCGPLARLAALTCGACVSLTALLALARAIRLDVPLSALGVATAALGLGLGSLVQTHSVSLRRRVAVTVTAIGPLLWAVVLLLLALHSLQGRQLAALARTAGGLALVAGTWAAGLAVISGDRPGRAYSRREAVLAYLLLTLAATVTFSAVAGDVPLGSAAIGPSAAGLLVAGLAAVGWGALRGTVLLATQFWLVSPGQSERLMTPTSRRWGT
jgi:hypothetical protein